MIVYKKLCEDLKSDVVQIEQRIHTVDILRLSEDIRNAVEAIDTVQAENERLNAEIEALKKNKDFWDECWGDRCAQIEKKNERLKRELVSHKAIADMVTSENGQLQKQLDAAVEDLRKSDVACVACINSEVLNACDHIGGCQGCTMNCPCRNCFNGGLWQWRGIQEEDNG